jgi:hypothetical protein
MAKSIILFDGEQIASAHKRLAGAVPDLANFNGRTSAVIVCEGTWHLHDQTNFTGISWPVHANGGPNHDGVYSDPASWGGTNNSIKSVN